MKNNNKIKSLCLAVAFLLAGITANAQLETSIFLNGSTPTGQFNDKVTLDEGQVVLGKDNIGKSATAGIGLGARIGYRFDIGYGEVAPFVNLDIQWNRCSSDIQDAHVLKSSDCPEYFNVPIVVGIQYAFPLTDIIKPFAEFAVGSDIFMATQEGWGGSSERCFYRYSIRNALCWELGAGSYFGRHVSAGIYYYNFGKHWVTYNDKTSRHEGGAPIEENTPVPLKLGSLVLRVGFHF